MRRSVIVLILIAGLLIIGSLIGYFAISRRIKEPSTSGTQSKQSLIPAPRDINLETILEPLRPGFSKPKTNNSGDRVVTLIGQLSKVTLGPEDHYFFEMEITNDKTNYAVSVDLGTKDFKITEYVATATHAPTSSNPGAVKISQQFSTTTAQALFEKYQGKIGQMIALDIVTNMKPISPCNEECTVRSSFYQTYAKANKLLETLNLINQNDVLRVGFVSQMTGGHYVL